MADRGVRDGRHLMNDGERERLLALATAWVNQRPSASGIVAVYRILRPWGYAASQAEGER